MEGQGWAGKELSPTDIEACRKAGGSFLAGPVTDGKEVDVGNGYSIA